MVTPKNVNKRIFFVNTNKKPFWKERRKGEGGVK